MANLKPQPTTDRFAADLLDEEDERERVLLVVVGDGAGESAGDRDGDSPRKEMVRLPASTTYALNVSAVREVIRARTVTRVPGTPRFMRGLVNVRGMVVTVLDLAECLNEATDPRQGSAQTPIADTVTETSAQTPGSIVLLEHGGRLVGLAVDAVRDVRPLDDAGLIAEGSVLAEGIGVKRGLTSAGGEVVTLLDVAALLSRHMISSGET